MNDSAWRWRTIEHTADLAVELEAPSLEELFLAAASGLAGVLRGDEEGQALERRPLPAGARVVELRAPDREALLVEWLRELLYLQMAEGLLYSAAEIEALNETRVVASVLFSPATEATGVERELKGVTYHDLEINHRETGWYARVVFDL